MEKQLRNSYAIIPQTLAEVASFARMCAASGVARVGTAEAAAVIICAGLELGLTPIQALQGMHLMEGRVTLAADTIVALVVRRTDVCEYWRCIEATASSHTIETKRRGDEFRPVRRTWTLEDAKRAGLVGRAIWQRYPADMLRHRCSTALAREVYPDLVAGMAYTREEIDSGAHEEPQKPVGIGTFDPDPMSAAASMIHAAATVEEVAEVYLAARGGLETKGDKAQLWRFARVRAADLGVSDDDLKAACEKLVKATPATTTASQEAT